jgi:hypothetical protein
LRRRKPAGEARRPAADKPGALDPRKPEGPRRSPDLTLGWREWVALPDLHVERIKVKVDTGARSSALHAYNMRIHYRRGAPWVEFEIHPLQRATDDIVSARAEVVGIRSVRSSSGQVELRPVIETHVGVGEHVWPIELTLTKRDEMGFRMLLGRQAIRGRFLVDGGRSYLQSRKRRRVAR